MSQTVLVLSIPPSVNSIYGNKPKGSGGPGRYVTQKYKKWRDSAMLEVIAQGAKPHEGAVVVEVRAAYPASGRRRDADNLLKPIIDLLVKSGLIIDDNSSILQKVSVAWGYGEEGSVAVFIEDSESQIKKPKHKNKEPLKVQVMKQLKRRGIVVDPSRVHVQ